MVLEYDVGTVEATECCASWTVAEFPHLSEGEYESPAFSVKAVDGDVKWCMFMWPYGRRTEDKGHVSVGLWRWGGRHPDNLLYQASIYERGYLTHQCPPTNSWDWNQLVQRGEVLSESGHMTNGKLKLHMKFWRVGSAEPYCSHPTLEYGRADMPLDNSLLLKNDPKSFFFNKWYKDPKFTDMTAKVDGKEFKIHKLVFASRSQVFYAMMGQDMLESNTSFWDITDMTSEGFERLIEYMYTGRVADLDDFPVELLNAAEKYELDELKVMCEVSLKNSISEDTVLEVLTLAHLYRAPRLMETAMEYVKQHANSVTESEEWRSFLSMQPKLATEVCHYLLLPNKSPNQTLPFS